MVPISLRPLEKFEVILHLTLNELFDVDRSIDPMPREAIYLYLCQIVMVPLRLQEDRYTLENLEVLKIRIFGVDVKLDSLHRDVHVDAVKDLT